MPWLDRVALAASRLAGTRGAILCFHGIDLRDAPSGASMHVKAELLAELARAARKLGSIVSLQEIVSRQLAGQSTAGLFAFTADDAYASWLTAEPLLQHEEIPLTLFAVANALLKGDTFWWDRVDDCAALAASERWHRFEEEAGLPAEYRRGQPKNAGPARPIRQWVLAAHAGRCPPALDAALSNLEKDLGHHTVQRSMTDAELTGFLARTGAQLGVHTVSHAALPFLPDEQLVSEVRQGYLALRARIGPTLPYLAIPFGLFDARTLRLASNAGMTVSLTLEAHALDLPMDRRPGMPRLCVVREHRPGSLMLKTSSLSRLIDRVRGNAAAPYPVLPSPTT